MDTLPNEIILVIFNYLIYLPDVCNFALTCKKYNKLIKELMGNAKYPVFEIFEDGDGYPVYDLICICDTIELCRECIKVYASKYPSTLDKYNAVDADNYCILFGSRHKIEHHNYYTKHYFIVEKILMNKLIKV